MLYNLKDQLSRKRFETRVKALWDAGAVVELKDISEVVKQTDESKRTNLQNKHLHVALGILATETGYSLESIKSLVFKRMVNPDLFIVEKDDPILGHIQILRSSRDLDKEEMSKAIDRYRKFCADNGVYIPSPEEKDLLREAAYEIAKIERYL